LLAEGTRYTEISVQRIIDEAGIARSTFYVHFRDKTDLLERLGGAIREHLYGIVSQWEPFDQAAGADGLAEAFEQVIAFHRQHADIITAMTETAALDPGFSAFYLEEFELKVTRQLVGERAAGRTDAGLEPVAAARVIVWGGHWAITHHISVDDGSGDARLARELARIWWHGAYRRQAD